MTNTALNYYINGSDRAMRKVYDEDTHEFLGYNFTEGAFLSDPDIINLINLERELNYWLKNLDKIPYTTVQLWGLNHYLRHARYDNRLDAPIVLHEDATKCCKLLCTLLDNLCDFRGEPKKNMKYK